MKNLTIQIHVLTGELSSWFQLIESLNMNCARPYACVVPEFFVKRMEFGLLFAA